MIDPNKLHDLTRAAVQAAFPVVSSIYGWLNGLDWATLVAPATLLYIGLQAAYMLWRWRRDKRREDAGLPPAPEAPE